MTKHQLRKLARNIRINLINLEPITKSERQKKQKKRFAMAVACRPAPLDLLNRPFGLLLCVAPPKALLIGVNKKKKNEEDDNVRTRVNGMK